MVARKISSPMSASEARELSTRSRSFVITEQILSIACDIEDAACRGFFQVDVSQYWGEAIEHYRPLGYSIDKAIGYSFIVWK